MRQYLILLLFFTGCGLNALNPIIVNRTGSEWGPFAHKSYVTIASTAQRRLIILSFDQPDGFPRFCAEPPPDVADNVASSLKMALTGMYQGATVGEDFQKALNTVANQLATRSQGLQFYRDGMFYLCQAWLNNLMTKQEFDQRQLYLIRTAEKLISQEIPTLRISLPIIPPPAPIPVPIPTP